MEAQAHELVATAIAAATSIDVKLETWLTIVGMAMSTGVALFFAGMWVTKQLTKSRGLIVHEISKLSDKLESKIDDHEQVDQRRHEDNLKRFGRIDVGLARLGLHNGGSSAEETRQ